MRAEESIMRKIMLTLVAAVSLTAATLAAPKPAEARCYGCWVGAGVAAGVLAGAAIANAGAYGAPAYYSGYGPYQPAYYGGYYRPYGFGHFYGRPHYSRFGYWGPRSPFYYGWEDPFWYGGGGYGPYNQVRGYTEYKGFVDLDIRRKADNAQLFDGHAKARSTNDNLGVLVPNLIEALFTGFPGKSGETVKITVPPARKTGCYRIDRRRRRSAGPGLKPVVLHQFHLGQQGHQEGRRPAEHDDSGGAFDRAEDTPVLRQQDVAIADRRIGLAAADRRVDRGSPRGRDVPGRCQCRRRRLYRNPALFRDVRRPALRRQPAA